MKSLYPIFATEYEYFTQQATRNFTQSKIYILHKILNLHYANQNEYINFEQFKNDKKPVN